MNIKTLVNQLNQNKLETTIFTNQLGGASGVRGKGYGSFLTRVWDWLSSSGVSCDKQSVINRINEAFSNVSTQGLKELKASFTQDEGGLDALKSFQGRLRAMQVKFCRAGINNLEDTIGKIEQVTAKFPRLLHCSQKTKPSVTEKSPPKGWEDIAENHRGFQARFKRDSLRACFR